MKIFVNILFLFLVSVIGFVLPWWTLFILCFMWSYLRFGRTPEIMLIVFFSHACLISYFGGNLLMVLNLMFVKNTWMTSHVFALSIAFVFAGISGLISSLAKDSLLLRR